MFIPKCFQGCQHKLGMFIMQFASSSSPKSGQFSNKAPRNCIVCIIHNAGSKINSFSSPTQVQSPARSNFWHSEFRENNVLFAAPKGQYSQVNKEDNEVQPLGQKIPLGKHSHWETAVYKHSIQKKKNHNGFQQYTRDTMGEKCSWQSMKIQEGSTYGLPFSFASPPGDHQVLKSKFLGTLGKS